ncbi:MAG: N-acetylmuramic acid 6-phosphate etherase [Planctomycetia bacterium]|nr:N-acetylmuramic acid 6-phosphate etherase [Planctomycetia bacterium]MBL6915025.1 N-acetylmuramic acid 6-phosphate etherase [Planctomycetota bacterium]HCW45608.1 N-acetylmuramic acid 6-phosphate etherase [Planctomycetota bacterium]
MSSSPTEGLDPSTLEIKSAEQCWEHFESGESGVQEAISRARESVLVASSLWAETMRGTGRVIGLGAGTSGRLLALEMAEWGPTFSVPEDRCYALVAGGDMALTRAVEGAEDDGDAGRKAIEDLKVSENDLVLGISASGMADFVAQGLEAAGSLGAKRVFITGNPAAVVPGPGGVIPILIATGSETVAGSTRLRAATATHRILQRISTMGALRLGWIYRGRMVMMKPTNRKLRARALTIVSQLADVSEKRADSLISMCSNDLRLAVACGWLGKPAKETETLLDAAQGQLELIWQYLEPLKEGSMTSNQLAERSDGA